MLLHLVVLDTQQAGVLVTTFLLLLLVYARELAPLDNANAEITKIITVYTRIQVEQLGTDFGQYFSI